MIIGVTVTFRKTFLLRCRRIYIMWLVTVIFLIVPREILLDVQEPAQEEEVEFSTATDV